MVSGADNRRVGRRAGSHLDHPSVRFSRRGRSGSRPEASARRVLQARTSRARVRSAGHPAPALGRARRTRLSVALVQPWHLDRPQGQRLDRRQRRRRWHRDQVHAGWQVHHADRQASADARQQQPGAVLEGGEDQRGSEDERDVRGRRLRQQARGGDRRGHRQVQADLGRIRQRARRQA